jgi:hypothetical protein
VPFLGLLALLGRIEASSRQCGLGVYDFASPAFLFSLELLHGLPVVVVPQKLLVLPQLVLVLGLRDYFQIRPST